MAKIQFKKGDAYLMKIAKLEAMTREAVCGKAIYGAAEIVTDEVRKQLKAIPTDEGFATTGDQAKGPKKIQKAGLYNSLGIASLQDDGTGFLNVKIGFDGYNGVRTKRWPKGQPNQMVARSVERGTSYLQPNPFVKKAVASSKSRALNFMKTSVDQSIEEIMKG